MNLEVSRMEIKWNGNFGNFDIERQYDEEIQKISDEIIELDQKRTRLERAKAGFIAEQKEAKARFLKSKEI